MVHSRYKLAIENPCEQSWNSMTSNEVGKHCSLCSKTVIDFTNLKDSEIIDYIEQTSNKICGRLKKEQLNRILENKQRSNSSRFYKILTTLLLISTTDGLPGNVLSKIQSEVVFFSEKEKITNQVAKKDENQLNKSINHFITGTIYDSKTNEPIPNAVVFIKNSKVGATSNLEGKFKFSIPDSLITEKIIFVSTAIGYLKNEVIYNGKDLPTTKDFYLTYDEGLLTGEVCVVKKKRWWQFWK